MQQYGNDNFVLFHPFFQTWNFWPHCLSPNIFIYGKNSLWKSYQALWVHKMLSKQKISYFPSRVPFPPLKIQKIPQKWPKIVNLSVFWHLHSKILGIHPILSYINFMLAFLSLYENFISNSALSTKHNYALQKPLIFISRKSMHN